MTTALHCPAADAIALTATQPTTLDLERWRRHFAANRCNRPEPDWTIALAVPEHALPKLRQSMREFQLGDGGGPASLIAFDAHGYVHQSEALRAVVAAWFTEEREHSRLLGAVVARLGGTPITSHWSFRLFCGVRRLMGVRFELQILTVTELTSTAYYTLLRRHYRDPALDAALALILRDEAGHLAFHLDRLTAEWAGKPRWLRRLHRWQFIASGIAAATVLWTSHQAAARAMGATHGEFAREVGWQIGRSSGGSIANVRSSFQSHPMQTCRSRNSLVTAAFSLALWRLRGRSDM